MFYIWLNELLTYHFEHKDLNYIRFNTTLRQQMRNLHLRKFAQIYISTEYKKCFKNDL